MCLKCHWNFEHTKSPPWEFQTVGKYGFIRIGQCASEVCLDKEFYPPRATGGALKGVNSVKFQYTTPPTNIKLK